MSYMLDRVWMNFDRFISQKSPEKLHQLHPWEPACLADFIQVWMEHGDGIRECHGDRLTFAFVLSSIIDAWVRDPGITDYLSDDPDDPDEWGPTVERRVTTVFGNMGFRGHQIMDPFWFEEFAFQRLRDNPPRIP